MVSAVAFATVTATCSLVLSSLNYPAGATPTITASAVRPLPVQGGPDRPHPMVVAAAAAPARWWTVRSGDTLSGIARARYHAVNAWTLIYWANQKHIRWANQIQIGQKFYLPGYNGHAPAPPRLLEPPPPPPPPVVTVASSSTSTGGSEGSEGSDSSAGNTPTYSQPAPSGTYHGASGYEACVIARESGGNPSAVNASSGAGGLYQFLPSTWQSLGYSGLPQDAPVSVQQQAFQKLYAEAGTSPWSPSDGC